MGRPYAEVKHELEETKTLLARLHAETSVTRAHDARDGIELQSVTAKARLYADHVAALEKVLRDSRNGTFIERHWDTFKKVMLILAVGSEVATIPLLLINIWAMLHKHALPFVTESAGQNAQNDQYITHNPLVSAQSIQA